jgi:hypothetical protein
MQNPGKRAIVPRGDAWPAEGFAVAVDGKVKSQYKSTEDAFKAGLEIKRKFPLVQVTVYDAEKRTRVPVETPAPETPAPDKAAEPTS